MSFSISYTSQFNKDLKQCVKRRYDISLIKKVIETLEKSGTLPSKFKPHKLSGNYKDCWECHIKPDWLLIWIKKDSEKEIIFIRTGTHADLF